MKYLSKFAGVYLAYLIQVILLNDIKILYCSPDLILTVLVIMAVSCEFPVAAMLGGFAGMLMDALQGRVFGINILIYMYFALIISLLTDKKTENSPLIVSWISLISIATEELVIFIATTLLGYSVPIGYLFNKILVKGIFGMVFTMLFVLVSQKRKARKEKVSERKEGNV